MEIFSTSARCIIRSEEACGQRCLYDTIGEFNVDSKLSD